MPGIICPPRPEDILSVDKSCQADQPAISERMVAVPPVFRQLRKMAGGSQPAPAWRHGHRIDDFFARLEK